MSDLKIYKEIGSVPNTFGSDSIYAVRTGPGFDLFMTDTTGSVAYKINSETSAMKIAEDTSDFTAAFNAAISNQGI